METPKQQENKNEQQKEEVDLYDLGKEKGIKYFMPQVSSFHFGSKGPIVPLSYTKNFQKEGFALWALQELPLDSMAPEVSVVPDPNTLIQLPWDSSYAWLSCNVFYKGKPLPQCPRGVLQKQILAARERGLEIKSGIEVEFQLLNPADNSVCEDGGGLEKWVYYEQIRTMQNAGFLTKILDTMDSLNWEPTYALHEVGQAQYEINYKYSDTMTSCDKYMFLKFMIKQLAEQEGKKATFMPQLQLGKPGNGLHLHLSLWSTETGQNVVPDETGDLGLSDTGRYWLGGLMKHLPAITAIACSQVNSYKRLHAFKYFLNIIAFGDANKFPAIRLVPDNEGLYNRFEIRVADPPANPYLLHAAIIAAGLDGIDNKIEPDPSKKIPHEAEIDTLPKDLEPLPKTLENALEALNKDEVLIERLGNEVIKSYTKLKGMQLEAFNKTITEFEKSFLDMY